ncbi:MAG: FkbM family methyltransferase [Bacteroidales bacterium]
MFTKIKNALFGENKQQKFNKICTVNKISLEYNLNKNELQILSDIFEGREYSDYFPFYKKVTIIDIGAHYGYFSIFANKNTNNQSTIFAIEPSNMNFEKMTSNINKNKIKNIVGLNCAVGTKNENAKLYIGNTSNNSLIRDYSLLKKEKSIEEIEIKTLDTIISENKIEKIDFLKMDCEGSEYLILENIIAQTFDKISTISMEFHDLKNEKYTAETLLNILINNNFKILKYQYNKTSMGLNYGKIIASKIFN